MWFGTLSGVGWGKTAAGACYIPLFEPLRARSKQKLPGAILKIAILAAGAEARSRPEAERAASRVVVAVAATVLVRPQLGLDCGYAGPTIAGVEAAGAKSS